MSQAPSSMPPSSAAPSLAASSDERRRVLSLIRKHGWNATAFQTLEAGYCYYFCSEDACVAYVETPRAWVVAGAPLAAPEQLGAAALTFMRAARAAGKRCCFFASEARLREATGGALDSLLLGEQPVWDPRDWPDVLGRHKSLREQLRRARAKGVQVRELSASDLEHRPLRDAVERLVERWSATRSMAPMDFLVRIEPFSFPEHRRCFVAEIEGRLVGFAGVVPVPARAGWFLEDLLRDPTAPNGTGELLVDAVMRWAAGCGCDWLTLGLAPLSGNVSGLLRAARRGGRLLYDFEGLRAYKAKLRPELWSPLYLAYPPEQGALLSLLDALSAFTRGGFLRFGVRSLLRGPTLLVRALAFSLVPWTLLLTLAPAEPWFGGATLKWCWVGFDLLLLAGLVRFLRKRSTASLTPLAIAVTLDALLTPVQALLWNLPRARGALDYLIIVVACSAPPLAALVLWGARRTRRSAR